MSEEMQISFVDRLVHVNISNKERESMALLQQNQKRQLQIHVICVLLQLSSLLLRFECASVQIFP